MKLQTLAVVLMMSRVVWAQSAGGMSVDPSKEGGNYGTTVTERSPSFTQDRVFGGTRFWLLDPGRYEVEVWYNDKFQRDGTQEGVLQAEIEIGLAPHLQLDIYQNMGFTDKGEWGSEGQQIELRYAFGRVYNEIPLNPVLYLEWHPRKKDPGRAEIKLLLGSDVMDGFFLWAVNVYFETNVDDFLGTEYAKAADAEIGANVAASFAVVKDWFRLGAEVKAGVDQHGNDGGSKKFYPVAMVGPTALFKVPDINFKLTGTVYFGIIDKDPKVYPLVIAGWQF